MKKIIISLIFFASLFLLTRSVTADENRGQTIKRMRQEFKNELNLESNEVSTTPAQTRKQIKEEMKEQKNIQKQSLFQSIKNRLKRSFRFAARITGKIASKGTDSLVVTGTDGKTYTVNITGKTQFRRRFWGKSSLSEMRVGDEVNVIGRFTDDTQLTIEAVLIRDTSIQRRWGVFFGTVTTIDSNSFSMDTINRGSQKVDVGSGTKYIKRNQETMSFSDIAVGHRVRVKGVWDKNLNEIIQTDEVKDFSLPPQPTGEVEPTGALTTVTPTSTPTTTPTVTPTPTATPTPTPTTPAV